MQTAFRDFYEATNFAQWLVKTHSKEVDTGRWQGVSTEGKPDLVTLEVLDFKMEVPVDRPGHTFHEGWSYLDQLADEIKPNREWADEHFAERVGGVPMNPDPSHERWPFWRGQDSTTKDDRGQFTHTYSERFWPYVEGGRVHDGINMDLPVGIRFRYGTYADVVRLLGTQPYTRQAYLPIFFPEDTGAYHGGRVPCTLGYHFMMRSGYLHLWYDIRSCDLYRHFRDDIYLAVRLMLRTIDLLRDHWELDLKPGTFYFNAHSLHIHKGDWHHVYDSPR